jgi:hypothetical protein
MKLPGRRRKKTDPGARRIVVSGASLSMVLASLLGGLALLVLALRDVDVHLRLDLDRSGKGEEGSEKLIESPDYSLAP